MAITFKFVIRHEASQHQKQYYRHDIISFLHWDIFKIDMKTTKITIGDIAIS